MRRSKKSHRALWILLGLATSGLIPVACEADDDTRPLSASERREVAQLYADSVRVLAPLMDSLCETNREALVATLADSLFEGRRQDLERQRKRLPQ